MSARSKFVGSLCLGLVAVTIAGCASRNDRTEHHMEMRVDEKEFIHGTKLKSQDIATVADQIARGILEVPEIAKATKLSRIVLTPVKNYTRFELNRDVFLDEMVAMLNEHAAGKLRFLARHRISKQQFKGADYVLNGKLDGEAPWASEGTSDYVIYSFELVDPHTREIISNGSHRLRRQVH